MQKDTWLRKDRDWTTPEWWDLGGNQNSDEETDEETEEDTSEESDEETDEESVGNKFNGMNRDDVFTSIWFIQLRSVLTSGILTKKIQLWSTFLRSKLDLGKPAHLSAALDVMGRLFAEDEDETEYAGAGDQEDTTTPPTAYNDQDN